MLDLNKRQKRYWDLTLHDGTKLQIPTPTRGVYGAMMEVSKKGVVNENELTQIVVMILKTNKQGVEITQDQIDAFDLDDMYALFIDYTQFIQEVLSDPNFKSPIAP